MQKALPWLSFVGLSLVLTLLGWSLDAFPLAQDVVYGFSFLCVLAALGVGIRSRSPRRDPYDLAILKEIDDKEALRLIDPDQGFASETLLCPCCHEVYPASFPACPTCSKPGRQRRCCG